MTPDEMRLLVTLLGVFAQDRETDLAESISRASTDTLAVKMYDQGQENLRHVHFVKRWVEATIASANKP